MLSMVLKADTAGDYNSDGFEAIGGGSFMFAHDFENANGGNGGFEARSSGVVAAGGFFFEGCGCWMLLLLLLHLVAAATATSIASDFCRSLNGIRGLGKWAYGPSLGSK